MSDPGLIMPRRLAVTALSLFVIASCGGDGGDTGPNNNGIAGNWHLNTMGGHDLPAAIDETTIIIERGTATFSDEYTFTMTYAGTLDGEPLLLVINGTFSNEGATHRLNGSASLNGAYWKQVSLISSVVNGVMTYYSDPQEVWTK